MERMESRLEALAGAAPRGVPAADRIRRAIFTIVVTILIAVNAAGLGYYTASSVTRLRHPLRAYFKPSGTVGQPLAILALLLFLFLWLYPLRKRLGARVGAGSVARWLDFHIAAGILAPFVAATHAGWRFSGLIGLGYGAMVVVALSGAIGRYLYTRIPRSLDGAELGRNEAGAERRALLGKLSETTGLAPHEIEQALAIGSPSRSARGPVQVIGAMFADDLARRRTVRALVSRLAAAGARAEKLDPATLREVARLARREMALDQQVRMLDAAQRVFRLWHAAHQPFAATALLAVLTHVIVAIAVGQTWFW
jgi:ADP-ribose pyrophosphatase YjhB (NUDIX family)